MEKINIGTKVKYVEDGITEIGVVKNISKNECGEVEIGVEFENDYDVFNIKYVGKCLFPIGCDFCENEDFSAYSAKVEKFNGVIHVGIAIAGGSSRFPIEKQFNFCPVCGRYLK